MADGKYSAPKARREHYSPMHSREVIKLQHYPNAQRERYGPLPIEKEDWPAPPAVAAAYPELCKENLVFIRTTFLCKLWCRESEASGMKWVC